MHTTHNTTRTYDVTNPANGKVVTVNYEVALTLCDVFGLPESSISPFIA